MAQLCEYNKHCWIVYFKRVNFLVYELYNHKNKNKEKQKKLSWLHICEFLFLKGNDPYNFVLYNRKVSKQISEMTMGKPRQGQQLQNGIILFWIITCF